MILMQFAVMIHLYLTDIGDITKNYAYVTMGSLTASLI